MWELVLETSSKSQGSQSKSCYRRNHFYLAKVLYCITFHIRSPKDLICPCLSPFRRVLKVFKSVSQSDQYGGGGALVLMRRLSTKGSHKCALCNWWGWERIQVMTTKSYVYLFFKGTFFKGTLVTEGRSHVIETKRGWKFWLCCKMSLHTKKRLHPNRQFKRHGNSEGRCFISSWMDLFPLIVFAEWNTEASENIILCRDSHPFGVPEDLHVGQGQGGSQGRRRQDLEDFRRETEAFRKRQEPKRSPGVGRKFRGNSFSSLSPSSHSRCAYPNLSSLSWWPSPLPPGLATPAPPRLWASSTTLPRPPHSQLSSLQYRFMLH